MKKKFILKVLMLVFVAGNIFGMTAVKTQAVPFRYEEEWNARTNSWEWGRSAIHWAYAEGITSGKIVDGVNCFAPDQSITRAEAATMLVKMKGIDVKDYEKDSEEFTDVDGAWYTPYVNAAFANNIVSGKGDGIFDPNGNLTRAEAVTMVVKAMGYKATGEGEVPFEDISDGWYTEYIENAYENKIVSGKSKTQFDPDGQVTRAELAMMLYNTEMRQYEKGTYCAVMIPDDARSFEIKKGEEIILTYDEDQKQADGATRIYKGEDWQMVYFTPTDSFELIPANGNGTLTKMRIFANGREIAVGTHLVSKVMVEEDKSVTVFADANENVIHGSYAEISAQENLKMEADNGDVTTTVEVWENAVKSEEELTKEGFESVRKLMGTEFGKFSIYHHPFSEFYKFSPADDSISLEVDVDFNSKRIYKTFETQRDEGEE